MDNVWVDDAGIVYRRKRRYHLAAATLDELHAFAKSIEVNRCWFHPGSLPHYDITGQQRERAISRGATPVTPRELIERYRAATLTEPVPIRSAAGDRSRPSRPTAARAPRSA